MRVVILSRAAMKDCTFESSDLSGSVPKGASFIKTEFTQPIIDDVKFIKGTKFKSFDFPNISTNRVVLDKVTFNSKCVFKNISLANAKFNDFRIQDSYLEDVNLLVLKCQKYT